MPWGKSARTSQAMPDARAASPTKPMERACSAVTVPISSRRASADAELKNGASMSENFARRCGHEFFAADEQIVNEFLILAGQFEKIQRRAQHLGEGATRYVVVKPLGCE